MASVVPYKDNYFAALNSAVFSDGSFVYIPKGVRCPMELSTYFRINTANTGQFERTLIVADDNSYVSYLKVVPLPCAMKTNSTRHVEIVHSKVPRLNTPLFKTGTLAIKMVWAVCTTVTKREFVRKSLQDLVDTSRNGISNHVEVSFLYTGRRLLRGRVLPVAVTNNHQQADTGTKMIHLGKNTRSRIVSKGISAGSSNNSYRDGESNQEGRECS